MTTDNTTATKTPDTTKFKAALEAALKEADAAIDTCVKARNFGRALKDLASIRSWIDESLTKLTTVGQPRAKKERKAKK